MQILWITGPPGVGKSTVAWRLYQRLDPPVSHVDIDQLGMLAPAPSDDPDRLGLKQAALRRLAAVHAERGSRLLVVSGVSAPHGLLPTVVLVADEESIRTRLLARGADPDYIRAAIEAHRTASRHSSDPRRRAVDTAGREIDDVVDDLVRMLPDLLDAGDAPAPALAPTGALPPVVWIRSSRAVGASTAGFGLFAALAAERWPVAFLDAEQLSMARGTRIPRVATVLAVGSEAGARGARTLVAVGPLEADAADALRAASADVRLIRLVASPDSIAERVRSRSVGGPLHLAGDDLRGRVGAALDEAVDAAIEDAGTTRQMPDERVIDTDGKDPSETLAAVRSTLGELAGKITER